MTTIGRSTIALLVCITVWGVMPASGAFTLTESSTGPYFSRAITGCGPNPEIGCDDFHAVRMELSEPVTGTFQPADFDVDEAIVLRVSPASCEGCTRVLLFLRSGTNADGMDEDATPVAAYVFVGDGARSRPVSAAGQELPDGMWDAEDGIVPDVPNVISVSRIGRNANGQAIEEDHGSSTGLFPTNDATPVVTVSGLEEISEFIVSRDTNGSDDYEPGQDVELVRCDSQGPPCPIGDLGNDGPHELHVSSIDYLGAYSEGRTGPRAGKRAALITVVLDRQAPQITSFFSRNGSREITVRFDEALSTGRNDPADWSATTPTGTGLQIAQVSGTGQERKLTISPADLAYGGEIRTVAYDFAGPPPDHYRDAAGNFLVEASVLADGTLGGEQPGDCLDPALCSAPVPDPCYEGGVECPEEPVPVELPGEIRTVTRQVRRLFSPNGQVLVVDANILQLYAPKNQKCSNFDPNVHDERDFKGCNQAEREMAFARAVRRLALKAQGEGLGDGMSLLPDIILLQEAGRHSVTENDDVKGVLSALKTIGYDFYKAAAYRVKGHKIDDREGGEGSVDSYCADQQATSETKCRKLVRKVSETAIIYNSATMKKVKEGFTDTTYPIDDKRDCPGPDPMVAPVAVAVDDDRDGVDDCAVKWVRHYSANFAEVRLNRNNMPTPDVTGVRVAAASTLLIPGSHFIQDANDTEGNTRHEQRKQEWAAQVSQHLEDAYPTADTFVIGGDFNIHRCLNKDNTQPRDYEGLTCQQRAWWSELTVNQERIDTIQERHKTTLEDALELQYRDGCNQLNANGTCDPIQEHDRNRRIDFLFTDRASAAASHDLTCGMIQGLPAGVPPNCDSLLNPQRYSDHRLVWMLLAGLQ